MAKTDILVIWDVSEDNWNAAADALKDAIWENAVTRSDKSRLASRRLIAHICAREGERRVAAVSILLSRLLATFFCPFRGLARLLRESLRPARPQPFL
jgi:hypothetical protein